MKFPQRFFHRARVNVPVEVAWDVFTNHERLGEYTAAECRIIKEGSPDRNGLGCVRVIDGSKFHAPDLEEVVNYWHPNELFGYHATSGAALDNHQGFVRFWSHGPRETEWVYDMRMVGTDEILEQVPTFYEMQLAGFREFMRDAMSECERRGSESGIEVPARAIPLSERGGQLSSK